MAKLVVLGYEYSRNYGYFAIEVDDKETHKLERFAQLFTSKENINGISGDDSFVDFVYDKSYLELSDIRELWKEIKNICK